MISDADPLYLLHIKDNGRMQRIHNGTVGPISVSVWKCDKCNWEYDSTDFEHSDLVVDYTSENL